MLYWKIFLDVKNFGIEKTCSIYQIFEDELFNEDDRYTFPHFTHRETNQIVIKFHINEDITNEDNSERQKIDDIINRLKKGEINNVEKNYIIKHTIEDIEIEKWLMLAHHLASECILKLIETPRYLDLVTNKPFRRRIIRNSFAFSFTKLFFKKLANINIPINHRYLQYYEDARRKEPFNEFIDECVSITEYYKDEFANPDSANRDLVNPKKSVDFRERFLHFILLCSLTGTEDIFNALHRELMRVLRVNSSFEIYQKIAQMINDAM